MRDFQNGSRRSSRCKPGDRNLGGVAIASRKRASGVWEEEEKKRVVGESPPFANADAFAARDHAGKEGGVWGVVMTPALLLTRVVVVRSVPSSRRALLAPAPVAVVAAFESCMLTMQTERGWVYTHLRKARASVV